MANPSAAPEKPKAITRFINAVSPGVALVAAIGAILYYIVDGAVGGAKVVLSEQVSEVAINLTNFAAEANGHLDTIEHRLASMDSKLDKLDNIEASIINERNSNVDYRESLLDKDREILDRINEFHEQSRSFSEKLELNSETLAEQGTAIIALVNTCRIVGASNDDALAELETVDVRSFNQDSRPEIVVQIDGHTLELTKYIKLVEGTELGSAADSDWRKDTLQICFASPGPIVADESYEEYELRPRNIYLFDFQSNKLHALTNDSFDKRYPRFTPDGKYISYCKHRQQDVRNDKHTEFDIYMSELLEAGKRLKLSVNEDQLTSKESAGRTNLYPCWSADGEWLMFTVVYADDAYTIRVIDRKTKDIVTQFESGGRKKCRPFWHEDGTVYYSYERSIYKKVVRRLENGELYTSDEVPIANPDDTHERGSFFCPVPLTDSLIMFSHRPKRLNKNEPLRKAAIRIFDMEKGRIIDTLLSDPEHSFSFGRVHRAHRARRRR